ncbi:MAG: MarR family transcriptional regulator [Alphaproteobacteria bacterium]|nr:MarR family transcriptional regulator [Alphaproteobacteria bacterium]
MSSRKSVAHETTWHVRDHCLCLATQRAARVLSRRFDEAFRPLGITSGQFSLLMSLNREAPPPLGAVASLLAMDRTTLTANLKPLVKRGFVVVEVDPRDKRGRLLKLTPKGMTVLTAAVPIWTRTHREVERPLSDADELRGSLRALV